MDFELPIPEAERSAAGRLLRSLVQIPSGAWMFVLYVLYNKDKRQSQDNQDKAAQTKYRAWMFVFCMCCTVKAKFRTIKTQKQVRIKDKERTKKIPGGGDIFRTYPDQPRGPPSLLYNGYRVSYPA